MKEMPLRDRRLLACAALIAAAALFLAFALLPAWQRHRRAEEALAEAAARREEILRQTDTVPEADGTAETTEGFYPPLRADEIDELLTGLLTAHGLTPLELSLTERDTAALTGYSWGPLAGQAALPADADEALRRRLRTVEAACTAWGRQEDCLLLLDSLAAEAPALRLTALELDGGVIDPQHRAENTEPGSKLCLTLEICCFEAEEGAP